MPISCLRVAACSYIVVSFNEYKFSAFIWKGIIILPKLQALALWYWDYTIIPHGIEGKNESHVVTCTDLCLNQEETESFSCNDKKFLFPTFKSFNDYIEQQASYCNIHNIP